MGTGDRCRHEPTAPTLAVVSKRPSAFAFFVIGALAIAPWLFLGPAFWLIGQQLTGTHVRAEVLGCETVVSGRSAGEVCTAAWTIHGKRVTGDLEGASGFSSQDGHYVSARVHGDTAYVRSWKIPLILLFFGVLLGIPEWRFLIWLVPKLIQKWSR